jgi:glutamate-5-semialdehyde dehydrogenase
MAIETRQSVSDLCLAARAAARVLAQADSAIKDRALHALADALEARTPEILEANARDLDAGREAGLSDALMDRLALDGARIAAMAAGVREPTDSTSARCASRSASWRSSTRRGRTSRSTPPRCA